MKKYLLMMLVVLTGIVSSCKYDDEELWGDVEDLANRVSAIEALTRQMNGDIAAMQAIVTAVENQVAVSNVEKLTDGYVLHFTNGTTATIKNGTDGKDGANGADGEDGKDGADGKDGKDAPAIGVALEDGVYFWTLTVDGKTDWLTDEAGARIQVSTPGKDGEDGFSGTSGSSGKTPQLSVDKDGYWMVSLGGTPERIKDENGDELKAEVDEIKDGIASFKGVTVDEETITIVDKNNKEFVLALLKSLVFYDKDGNVADIKNIEWSGDFEYVFKYSLNLEDAKYEVVDDSQVGVHVDTEKQEVKLYLQSLQITDARAVLLFFNGEQTLTSVFKFKVSPWNGQASEVMIPEANGEYHIVTPADLACFANMVNSGESFEGKIIKLVNDLDLNNLPWTPIGQDSNNPFRGTFDGNGKTIKGLSVTDPVLEGRSVSRNAASVKTGAGLFGVVSGATFKDVTIKDAVVNPKEKVDGAGILVGCALDKVAFEGVTIAQEAVATEKASNEVKGSQHVGSVAGLVSASQVVVKNCEVKSATVTATSESTSTEKTSSAGGVIGMLEVKADASSAEAPKVEISGCKVDGIDLSSSSESENSDAGASAGGVIGSLKVDESVSTGTNMSEIIKVENNSVANTQVTDAPSTEAEKENVTQGAVVGNLAHLDSSIASGIIKDNQVSEDVKIETQLTVAKLQEIFNVGALSSGSVNTFDVKGSIESATVLEIPSVGADVTLNFASLVTAEGKALTIKQGNGQEAVKAVNKLAINMSAAEGGQYLVIQAPETSVTLASGTYASVTALTAWNTLVVEKGVTIQNLVVKDGGVEVLGHVVNLMRDPASTSIIELVVKNGGKVDNIPAEGFDVVEGNPGEQEIALKRAAKMGGTFTVTESIRLTSPLMVESDFVLNFENNGAFDGDIGQFVDSKGWKAMVVVKPGATFTYNKGGYFNTGHMETQLSCIRMVGGSDAPSKVIINDGSLIGTYHAILIDEDCQHAEVEINGGSLSCDWYNAFNGVSIFNKSNAKITVNGGDISSCASAIETWGGELNISGGQLSARLTELKEGLSINPSVGNTLMGPVVSVAPKYDMAVKISGGTFNGGYCAFYEKKVDETKSPLINLLIKNGIFNGAVWSKDCTGFIASGKFKVEPEAASVAEGKQFAKEGDYYVIQAEVNEGNANGNNFGNGGVF